LGQKKFLGYQDSLVDSGWFHVVDPRPFIIKLNYLYFSNGNAVLGRSFEISDRLSL